MSENITTKTSCVLNVAMVQPMRERFGGMRNLDRISHLMSQISNVDVVCLPEVWMGAMALDEEEMTVVFDRIGGIAKERNFAVLTGGLFVKSEGRVMDICHVINASGRVAGQQIKLLPSAAVGEREYCTGGDEIAIFDIAGVKVGVAVCVDVMYPEIVRRMALGGAEVIFNPSNIPEQRIGLWHSIIRARAAENTVFVVFGNNTGTEYADGRAVEGGSIVCGPDGEILISTGSEETVMYARIDTGFIHKQRERWKYHEDVRKEGLAPEIPWKTKHYE